jgi:hypothetical protein
VTCCFVSLSENAKRGKKSKGITKLVWHKVLHYIFDGLFKKDVNMSYIMEISYLMEIISYLEEIIFDYQGRLYTIKSKLYL